VLVNGQEATVRSVAHAPTPNPGISRRFDAGSHVATFTVQNENDTDDEVEWEVEVTLAPGDNEVTVSVEADDGTIVDDVEQTTVNYTEVPALFRFDPTAQRIIGISSSLSSKGFQLLLVEHDLATHTQTTVVSDWPVTPSDFCVQTVQDRVVYLGLAPHGSVLREIDLSSGEDSQLMVLPGSVVDPGPGFVDGVHLGRLACDDDHANLYALFAFSDGAMLQKFRIVEIDPAAQTAQILSESDPDEIPMWRPFHMALSNGTLVTSRSVGEPAPLVGVSLADGARTELTPGMDVAAISIDATLAQDLVHIASFDGAEEITIGVTPERRQLSTVPPTDPLAFSQPLSVAFDADNDRLLIGETDLDAVIAVDRETGDRTLLVSRGIGDGILMIQPRSLALNAEMSRAYVADSGGNVPNRLIEIDLETRDRREIGDIHLPASAGVTAVVLDEERHVAYVAFGSRVLEVAIDDGAVTVIADYGQSGNLLQHVSGMLHDPDDNRLLLGGAMGIVELDLASRQQSFVSASGQRGTGPSFAGLNSLTRVGAHAVYVTNQTAENIMRVDLETGDREVALSSCIVNQTNVLGVDETLQQVLYVADANELLIIGDNLLSYDLDTEVCREHVPFLRVRIEEIRMAPDGRLLAIAFRALLQLDRASGDLVILSK
jgi:hypothetical protein